MSHSDFDHKMSPEMAAIFNAAPSKPGFLDGMKQLQAQADRLTERKENLITAGQHGEPCLAEAREDGLLLRKLPDDTLCVRVSLGRTRFEPPREGTYCVYRGTREEVIAVLEAALAALRASSMP